VAAATLTLVATAFRFYMKEPKTEVSRFDKVALKTAIKNKYLNSRIKV